MGAFAGTYVSAGIILLASLLVGRAILLALGRRQASFLEGAVGFATLIAVCSVAIRLPGDEATSIVCCAVLLVASIIFLLVRSESMIGPGRRHRHPGRVALAACSPRSRSSRAATSASPASGLNNDMAMHLVDVDYLVDPSRPEPQSVINGYPLGPHSLVGTVVSALGTQPLYGWLGLLVAVPVLTGITALGGLRELPGGRRLLAAALVAFAYLAASVLGVAGFKELIAGMFLIAFALGLREIEREPRGPDRDRHRPRADHGGDGPRLQPARRGLAGRHRRPLAGRPADPHPGGEGLRGRSARSCAARCAIVIPAADRPRRWSGSPSSRR